jgi:uncharacterized protein (TIGR02117 family)
MRGRPHRRLKLVLAAAGALPLLYLIAALAGALIPANPGWQQPPAGITIFVQTNGVHTSIVVPASDWSSLIRADHLRRPDLAGDHLTFGWGHREFFLTTPTWSDMRIDVAARALLGRGGALMHVDHLRDPQPDQDQRPIRVTPAQYRRLNAFILASMKLAPRGRAIPLEGYTATDLFYEARGRYTMFRTSNEWAGAALRHSGIKVGIWTPFAQSIMWRFPASGP